MSIVFNGELTSLYNQDEVSGPMQDSIGSNHFSSIVGGVFNGNSVTYDGIDDTTVSDTKANGVFIDPTADYTAYMHLKVLSALGSSNERWLRPVPAGLAGPAISPLFGVGQGQFFFQSHLAAGSAQVIHNIGRDVNVDEEFLVVWSYDFSAKKISCALASLDGVDLSAEATGTTDPVFGASDSYLMFDNTVGVFSHVELKEMGSIKGTYKTLLEIDEAVASWLSPPDTDLDIYGPIYPKIFPKII